MFTKVFYGVLAIIALIVGVWFSLRIDKWLGLQTEEQIAMAATGIMLVYGMAMVMCKFAAGGMKRFNRWLDNTSIESLVCGLAGMLTGSLVGLLFSFPLHLIKGIGSYLVVICFVLLSYLGMQIGSRRALEVWGLWSGPELENQPNQDIHRLGTKVLDTSAIIDGRIYDVCLSKFLEGNLIVPVFVIEELQHIADSSDNLRRSKGRRGLDLLSKMQKDPNIKVRVVEDSIGEEKEVDMKLIKLCKQLNASIITNDYNLNKVAELQGIKVLNINELTNAVKVVVYPGETMYINILKEGKEPGQGVGYLEDGTMVVVEDAQDQLGNNVDVMVTSVFQTAAGRMIFCRKVREERSMGYIKSDLPGEPIHEVNMYG